MVVNLIHVYNVYKNVLNVKNYIVKIVYMKN